MPRKTKKRPSRDESRTRRVRYAVVGLGYISQVAALPAFAHARKNSQLAALVSDEDQKLRKIGKKYGVSGLYHYDQYVEMLRSGQVDAVYIGLPNHLHREYTVKAAETGIHVLCEKPMAVTEDDCQEMIESARKGGVRLMIAYRLHFERANLTATELVQSGKIGDPRIFHSLFTMQVEEEENIRLGPLGKGGGTLYDIGIYCINAARYLFRDEPVEVFAASANNGEKRFRNCDEMTSAILRFPGERLATFTTSFGATPQATYEVVGTKGSIRLEKAYEYVEPIEQTTVVNDRTSRRKFGKGDQFAAELVYFSDCVLRDREPEPSGREGLADVRIIRALYESAEIGAPVRLAEFTKKRRPTVKQEIRRPPVEEPELVKVESPSGD